MKKLTITGAIIIALSAQAQFGGLKKPDLGNKNKSDDKSEQQSSSKAQVYIDGAKNYINKLDSRLASPKWSDSGFESGYKSELTELESKIASIKQKDPNYNVSEFESKVQLYKDKRAEATNNQKEQKLAESKKKEEAEQKSKSDAQAKLQAGVPDDGITNSVHQKYLGKIVFSSSEIPKDSPDESKFGASFPISSTIYLRVYLKGSVFNEVQRNYTSTAFDNQIGMLYKIYLDGAMAEQGRVEFSEDGQKFLSKTQMKTQTSISGAFSFNKGAFLSAAYIDALLAADSKLTEGEHAFKIELYPIYMSVKPLTETPSATGEFKLKVTKGFANAANPNICMPKAVKKDPALETKYKECLKKYLVDNNKNAVMKSFVLLSADWEIRKNEVTGVPISKTMYGAAGLSYKDGRCKYETYSFTQNWNGSAYGSTIETSSTGQDRNVFCDCLK